MYNSFAVFEMHVSHAYFFYRLYTKLYLHVLLIQIVISELIISWQTTVKRTCKCNFKLEVKKCVIPEHKDISPLGGFFF